MSADCVFCKIRDGKLPAMKVYEDERTLVFMDINPLNAGHCLVVTKTHAATIWEASEADLQAAITVAKKVALALREAVKPDGLNLLPANGDAAFEVIYTGLHQTPEQIVATAIQEDADAIGLSVLSGAHNYLFKRVLELLREKGAEDVVIFGGGIIPPEDIAALKAIGVKELFTPGTSTQDIVRFVREHVRAAV